MLRRHHRFFQSLQIIRDALLVGGCFYLAYRLRFAFPQALPFLSVSNARETLLVGLMLSFVWPMVGWAGGLYVSRRTRSVFGEIFDVFKTTLVAFLVLVTLTYFVRDVRYSRLVLGLWVALTFVTVSGVRVASRIAMRRIRMHGFNLRHVVVIGTSELARRLVDIIQQRTTLGLRIVGVLAHDDDAAQVGQRVGDAPIIATVSELRDVLCSHHVDQVLIALPIDRLGALKGIMALLSQETVDVRLVPDVHQYMTLCGSVEEFSGLPIINLQSTPLVGWNLFIKRGFDICAASLGLLLTAPLIALLAVAIKLTSPGPVFFRQRRVGMDGRHFAMVKLRTMHVNAEAEGERFATAGDPRCTPMGALLRRLSIDELPQLWNVVCGDMSLVGPRPERPCFIDGFKREVPRYALRHKIKAGMTGWAQIHGLRGNTSISRRIELDLYYIENWSLGFDLKILLRTLMGGFISRNAY